MISVRQLQFARRIMQISIVVGCLYGNAATNDLGWANIKSKS
jgi:hypothetical protein